MQSKLRNMALAAFGLGAALATLGGWSGAQAQGAAPAKPAELITITDELVKAAQKEGTVYVRYSAPTETTDAILAAFKRKYGINGVGERRVSAEGTNTFLAEERAGKHIVDVHVNTDRKGMVDLAKQGFYTPYKVTNDAQYSPDVKYKDFAYAPYSTLAVLTYNTDRLKPEDAAKLFDGTWNGLLDPRFKGKRIGIISPYITTLSSLWFWSLAEDPKYGRGFLEKVAAQDPIIYPDQNVAQEAITAGEVDVLVGLPLEPAWGELAKGARIAWAYPDILQAVPAVFHYISANAPHPAAARLFMAWLLSPEGATAISVDGGRAAVINADIPLNPKIKAALDKASWWKPYPTKGHFTPTIDDLTAREDGFRTEMAKMFNIPTRR